MAKVSSSKKVLMLLDNPLQSDDRVEKEAESLSSWGWEVLVLAELSKSLPVHEDRNGYRIKRVLNPLFKSPFKKNYGKQLREHVQQIGRESFDVLHCHDYHMLKIGACYKRLHPKTRLIYDAHEYLAGWPFYKESKGLFKQAKAYWVWKSEVGAEKENMHHVNKIITISKALSNRMQAQFGLKEAPVVLRNIPRKFPAQTESGFFQRKFMLPKQTKIMLYIGSFYLNPNEIRAIFNMIRDQKDLKLVIMGNTKRFLEVKAATEANPNFSDTIFFMDYIPDPQKRANCIAAADLGLVASKSNWESHRLGFSNKFMEYSMAGIPVVATRQDDCVSIAKKYKHAFFYHEKDLNELRTSIEACLANLDQVKANARKIQADFSWENESTALKETYNQLIDVS